MRSFGRETKVVSFRFQGISKLNEETDLSRSTLVNRIHSFNIFTETFKEFPVQLGW
jgi:hypothetical protein